LSTDVLDEVNVDKHPALADLGPGNLTSASLLLQGHGVDVQQCGRGLEIERVHRFCHLAPEIPMVEATTRAANPLRRARA
jgi:hypothetical protein